jgi:hypothetical protein
MNPSPQAIGEPVTGTTTKLTTFPQVNFLAPVGGAVTADMRAAVTTINQPAPGEPLVVLGAQDAGGVVLNKEELDALPGFTEFFPALLQAGL